MTPLIRKLSGCLHCVVQHFRGFVKIINVLSLFIYFLEKRKAGMCLMKSKAYSPSHDRVITSNTSSMHFKGHLIPLPPVRKISRQSRWVDLNQVTAAWLDHLQPLVLSTLVSVCGCCCRWHILYMEEHQLMLLLYVTFKRNYVKEKKWLYWLLFIFISYYNVNCLKGKCGKQGIAENCRSKQHLNNIC